MSLLYKNKKDINTFVEITQSKKSILLAFYSDGGKFGTEELLDSYTLTPERLLQILQEREDITENEI